MRTPEVIEQNVWDMVIDWLAAGVDPAQATLFIQSRVPEHAELHLLLSMITPLGWLERVPTYKDQQEKLSEKDLSTYGFLGYPLLQSADILIYRATRVPVGEDQVPHIELTREIARRFNHLFTAANQALKKKPQDAVKKLGSKTRAPVSRIAHPLSGAGRRRSAGSRQSPAATKRKTSAMADRERLFGYLEGGGKMILAEPQALLTEASRMPGLDGQKMSKSLQQHHRLARRRRQRRQKNPHHADRSGARAPHRSGQSGKMPGVAVASGLFRRRDQAMGAAGLPQRGIGCLECKQPVIDGVLAEKRRCASARSISGGSDAGAHHHCRWLRESARWRRKPCAMCAKRWGWVTTKAIATRRIQRGSWHQHA